MGTIVRPTMSIANRSIFQSTDWIPIRGMNGYWALFRGQFGVFLWVNSTESNSWPLESPQGSIFKRSGQPPPGDLHFVISSSKKKLKIWNWKPIMLDVFWKIYIVVCVDASCEISEEYLKGWGELIITQAVSRFRGREDLATWNLNGESIYRLWRSCWWMIHDDGSW